MVIHGFQGRDSQTRRVASYLLRCTTRFTAHEAFIGDSFSKRFNAFLGNQSSLPARPTVHSPNRRLSRFFFSPLTPPAGSPELFAKSNTHDDVVSLLLAQTHHFWAFMAFSALCTSDRDRPNSLAIRVGFTPALNAALTAFNFPCGK